MAEKRDAPTTCLLHIGKTGGTYLRSIVEHNIDRATNPIEHPWHRATLATTANKYGPNRRFAFVFRDPAERFVSGFNSRMRMGKPTHNAVWTADEAVTFMFFETPNDLAEALYSENERLLSASRFAMKAINHLRRNYSFYFESADNLLAERANLAACVELTDLSENLSPFLARIGLPDWQMPAIPLHNKTPKTPSPLSKLAQQNLHKFWAEEFAIYETCKDLSAGMFGTR